jgi:hypothetical protein
MSMKFRPLAFALWIGATATQAQVHPGSMFSIDLSYMPIAHRAQTWTASGYLVYNIQIERDQAGYITSMETFTPPPMDRSMDQYRTVGSRVDGVYSARTWKKAKDSTEFRLWRREVWNTDAKMDTLIIWEDSSAAGWTPVARKRMFHTDGRLDSITSHNWTAGSWVLQARDLYFHSSDQRDSVLSYTLEASVWKLTGKQVLFHGTDLDSMHGWAWDYEKNALGLAQRYAITNGAAGRTASFTQQKWSSSKSRWESGLGIVFSEQPLGIQLRTRGSSSDRIRATSQGLEITVADQGSTMWELQAPEGRRIASGSFQGDRARITLPAGAEGIRILVLSDTHGARRSHLVVSPSLR